MTIKPCQECGGPVSDKAEHCPRCGAKQSKKTSPVVILLAVLLMGAGVIAFMTPRSETPKEISLEQQAMVRQASARVSISNGLKDPDSAKFDENYKTGGCGRVNAKNSFGAYNGFKRFFVDEKVAYLEGYNITKQQMDDVWKKHCS